jgi:hypothetical protein
VAEAEIEGIGVLRNRIVSGQDGHGTAPTGGDRPVRSTGEVDR